MDCPDVAGAAAGALTVREHTRPNGSYPDDGFAATRTFDRHYDALSQWTWDNDRLTPKSARVEYTLEELGVIYSGAMRVIKEYKKKTDDNI